METKHIADVTVVIHEPIDRVWKALVDPKQIAQYMMGAKVISDWKEGSNITWRGEWKGKSFEDHGKVVTVREPELLKYTHATGSSTAAEGTHTVTIELKEVAGVTHLHLTQDNNASADARAGSEKNWNAMLQALKKMLGEAPVAQPAQPRS